MGLKRSDLMIDSRVHQLDMIPHDITMFRTFQHLAIHYLLKDRAVHRNFLFVSGDLSKLTINTNQSPSELRASDRVVDDSPFKPKVTFLAFILLY